MTNITTVLERLKDQNDVKDLIGEDAAELIDLFDKLEDKLPELKNEITGAEDPWSLYEAIRSGINDPVIRGAFNTVGIPEIYDRLKAFSTSLDDKIPEETEILLRRLGHFGETPTGTDKQRKSWSTGDDKGLIAWDKSGKIVSKSFGNEGEINGSFGVEGSLGLSLEAGSLWFYKQDDVSSKGLVRIGIAGSLGATLDGKMPFSAQGSLGLAAEAGVAAQAHLFYRRSEDDIVAKAIADIARHPVNIFSLEDVMEGCHGPAGLEGLIIAIDGNASLDIDLSVARDIDVEGFFNAKAGLTVSVDVARKAAYELSVRKVPDGVKMVLSHADEDSSKWGVGVGIEIDASAVLGRVAAVVKDGVEHWDSVLEDVKPFLSPGTWLQEKVDDELGGLLDRLSAKIGDDAVKKALRNDLKLLLGLEASAKNGIAKLLEKKVFDAISSVEDAVTGEARDLAKEAVKKLSKQLPATAQTQVRTKLEAEIEDLFERYQGELEDKIKGLAKDRAKDVSKALGKLGENVSDAVSRLNDRTKKLRELVEKTNKLVHKISDAVEKAAKAKITARIRFEKGRIENEQYELSGTFKRSADGLSEDAKALYRAILLGRLDGTKALFDADSEGVAGFEPDEDKCSISRFSKVSKSLGYEAVLLGLNLSGGSETSGSADVEIGFGGKIEVKANAIAKRSPDLPFGKSRKTDYVQTGSILLAKAEARDRPQKLQTSFVLDLSTQHTDTEFEAVHVKEFLALLHETSLIDQVRAVKATDYVKTMTGNRGGGKMEGAVIAEFGLDGTEATELARLGRGISEPYSRARGENVRKIIDTALDALFATGEWDVDDFNWFVANHIKPVRVGERVTHSQLREKFYENLHRLDVRRGSNRLTSEAAINYQKGKVLREAIIQLIELVATTAQMMDAVPSRKKEGNGSEWGLRDYRDASKTIADAAEKWIGTNQWGIIFFGKGLDQRTVAFMLILARLAGTMEEPSNAPGEQGRYDALINIALMLTGKDAKGF